MANQRKPYEKQVDLSPYDRLMRFLRWMSPELSAVDALRMLPESEAWATTQLNSRAEKLDSALRYVGSEKTARACITTSAELVPYIVVGRWAWPRPIELPEHLPESSKRFFKRFYRQGTTLALRQEGSPGQPDITKTLYWALPHRPPAFGEAVLLEGTGPTIPDLCQLAEDVRRPLHRIMEKGPRFGYRPISEHIQGRVIRSFTWQQWKGQEIQFRFEDTIAGNDFRAYCFWLLARILAEGHAWRIARCGQCGGFFLKTRQDPPDRPGRFCSGPCRRGWHNPRRPRNGRFRSVGVDNNLTTTGAEFGGI